MWTIKTFPTAEAMHRWIERNEYRHQIEVDIEPFKGLLLGIFFTTVGASVNLGVVWDYAGSIAIGVVALIALNGSNELINLGGGLANRYALIFAPLSIVQAIGSTTTLFVFAIGVALTMVLPGWSKEDLSPRELIVKGMAALLVAAGVTLVSR